MVLLLIPIIVGTFIWLAFTAYKSLVRRNATATWLMTFYLLFVVGASAGVYLGFFFSHVLLSYKNLPAVGTSTPCKQCISTCGA